MKSFKTIICFVLLFYLCSSVFGKNISEQQISSLDKIYEDWAVLLELFSDLPDTEKDFNSNFAVFYNFVNEVFFSEENRNSETLYYVINHKENLKQLEIHLSDLSVFINTHSPYSKDNISSYIYSISNDLLTMNILYSYFSKDTDTP